MVNLKSCQLWTTNKIPPPPKQTRTKQHPTSFHSLHLELWPERTTDVGVVLDELVMPVRQVLLATRRVARDDVHAVVQHIVRVTEQCWIAWNTYDLICCVARCQAYLGLQAFSISTWYCNVITRLELWAGTWNIFFKQNNFLVIKNKKYRTIFLNFYPMVV